MKTLPGTLTRLCNRLAAEEMKAQTWKLGQEVREEYHQRLVDGEAPADLEADLHRRVAQSTLAQFRLSIARRPTPQAERRNVSQLSSPGS